MKLADPMRVKSDVTFPRPRKIPLTKKASATIFRAKDEQHYKLDSWKTELDLVDQKTQFDIEETNDNQKKDSKEKTSKEKRLEKRMQQITVDNFTLFYDFIFLLLFYYFV